MLSYQQFLLENFFATPEEAYDYILTTGADTPSKDALDMLKTSSKFAFYYAKLNHRPWPEAEDVIKKDPRWAFNYACEILHDVWTEAEPYIQKNSEYAMMYATQLRCARWKDAEEVIKTNPFHWIDYLNFLARSTHDFDDDLKWEYLKALGTDHSFRILGRLRMPKEMQEYFIKKRPDLIGNIRFLDPELAKKYLHEIDLGKMDL